MAAIFRSGVALLLVLEAMNSTLWAARILSVAAAYDAVVLGMVGLRVAVSALQGTAAWQLASRGPSGTVLARLGLALSAVLLVVELGFRVAPSNVLPGFRYPTVVLYCCYALTGIAVLRWLDRTDDGTT